MSALRRTVKRLLLVIGWGVLSATSVASAQGFDLQLPPKLSLGTEQEAQISVLAPTEGQVRFFANVGRVTEVRREGGRIVATYLVPEERYPQVAIIVAASSDLSQIEWGSIPLHGQPTVKIRYGRRANVLVRAGEREFGPVQTDRRGLAELVVEVAPGVQSVTVFGADREGTTKERENPLEVPTFDRVFLVCPSEQRVLAFAVDQSGQPLRDVTLPIDAEVGTRTRHSTLVSGATIAEFDVPEDARSAFVAKSQAPGSEVPSRCTPPARASGFAVSLPDAFVAGQTPFEVNIRPLYEGDAPKNEAPPIAEVDFGELSQLERKDGAFVATWTVPSEFAGRSVAAISVARNDGGASDRHELPLRASDVKNLVVVAEDDSLRANGTSETKLVAKLIDRFGNPARVPAQLSAEASGEVGTFAQQPDGAWVASYVAPKDGAADVDVIAVREENHDLRVKIALELFVDRSSFLLSVRAGYLTNFSKVAGPIALLGLRYRLPFWNEMPVLGLDIGGYLSSTSDMDSAGEENVDADLFGVPVLVRAGLSLPLGSIDLFAHLAGGVLWSSVDVRSQSSGKLIEDDITFALGGFVGSEVSLGPGAIVLEAGYLLAPRGGSVEGQGAGLIADLGYGLAF